MKFFVRFWKNVDEIAFLELTQLINRASKLESIITRLDPLFCIVDCKREAMDFVVARAAYIAHVGIFSISTSVYALDLLNKAKTGRITVNSLYKKVHVKERKEIIEEYIHILDGKIIQMKDAEIDIRIHVGNGKYCYIFYKEGITSTLSKYDNAKRPFIGMTAMDIYLSILMANISGVDADSIVIDPFGGSGGVLKGCTFFNAASICAEKFISEYIGSRKKVNGVKTKLLGTWIYDNFSVSRESSYNRIGISAAIINDINKIIYAKDSFTHILTDLPYGVKIGMNSQSIYNFLRSLKKLSDHSLKKGGKLCFWVGKAGSEKDNRFMAIRKEVWDLFEDYEMVIEYIRVELTLIRVLYLFSKIK